MKKILSIMLAALMVFGLAGCGGGGGDAEGTTIKMWTMWNGAEPQGIVLQAAADAFKEKTGNTVEIEWKGREMNKIIMAALESGEDIDIFDRNSEQCRGGAAASRGLRIRLRIRTREAGKPRPVSQTGINRAARRT